MSTEPTSPSHFRPMRVTWVWTSQPVMMSSPLHHHSSLSDLMCRFAPGLLNGGVLPCPSLLCGIVEGCHLQNDFGVFWWVINLCKILFTFTFNYLADNITKEHFRAQIWSSLLTELVLCWRKCGACPCRTHCHVVGVFARRLSYSH